MRLTTDHLKINKNDHCPGHDHTAKTSDSVAIMFTDIVGYTKLLEVDHSKTLDLLVTNHQLHRYYIKSSKGTFIKEMGDGVLASFKLLRSAIQCAINIQNAAKQIAHLKLRIGIYFGRVSFMKNDVFGIGVNIAFRLQKIAEPGQILIASSVAQEVSSCDTYIIKLLRTQKVKNVKKQVRIHQVRKDQDTIKSGCLSNNSEISHSVLGAKAMKKAVKASKKLLASKVVQFVDQLDSFIHTLTACLKQSKRFLQSTSWVLLILVHIYSCKPAVIYESDNRKEWYDFNHQVSKQIIIDQVGCLVHSEDVSFNLDKHRYQLNVRRFDERICVDERFSNQSTLGFCTAFAVDKNIVATAGHCIREKDLSEFYIVFGFRMESSDSMRTELNLNEVYKPVEIVAFDMEGSADYALIKLSEEIYQYKNNYLRESFVDEEENISVVGYPLGLPVKFADSARVVKSDPQQEYYLTNLDTYRGNSGSPVFDQNDSIIGMLVGGSKDFEKHLSMECWHSIICPDSLLNPNQKDSVCVGETVIRISQFSHHLKPST